MPFLCFPGPPWQACFLRADNFGRASRQMFACCLRLRGSYLHRDTLAEWLRRRPAKPMGSPRVGSNPTGVVMATTAHCKPGNKQTQPDPTRRPAYSRRELAPASACQAACCHGCGGKGRLGSDGCGPDGLHLTERMMKIPGGFVTASGALFAITNPLRCTGVTAEKCQVGAWVSATCLHTV